MAADLPVVLVNGRYLRMFTSGVQRYAAELTTELITRPGYRWRFAIPPASLVDGSPTAGDAGSWSGARGHAWEQAALPVLTRLARADLLVNLCNWGPLAPTPQIVAIHDAAVYRVPQFFSPTYRAWHRLAVRRLKDSARSVVTLSETTKRDLVACAGIDPAKVVVVPPAVSGEFGRARPLDAPRPYCLLVGAHDRRKNADFLLEVWPAIGRRLDLDLHLVTHPNSRPHGHLGAMGDGVVVHSALGDAELAALYAGAQCTLWPSMYEGFGLPLLEGMAAGTPFLSTDVGAARELAVDDRQILPLDADAWAKGVEWILADRPRLSAESRAQAAHYSWSRSADLLLDVIAGALGRV